MEGGFKRGCLLVRLNFFFRAKVLGDKLSRWDVEDDENEEDNASLKCVKSVYDDPELRGFADAPRQHFENPVEAHNTEQSKALGKPVTRNKIRYL